jgi:cytochrome c-type biogenesis protein CcmH/NrfG
MNRKQLIVIAGCLVVGVALFLAPRTSSTEQKNEQATELVQTSDKAFESQVANVKKETSPSALATIEFFESKVKASTGAAKVAWLDSLSSNWDKQMRPGIAAEYVFQKATIVKTAESWKEAGDRFLGLSRFFEGEDKSTIGIRAIECLENAKKLDANDINIKTQLGVAYVETSQEPMKGIMLLREAVKQDSTNIDAQLNLGFFSMQSAQYDKAVLRFKKVILLKPELTEARLYLSDALLGEGKKEEAKAELLKIKQLTKDTLLLNEAKARLHQIKTN